MGRGGRGPAAPGVSRCCRRGGRRGSPAAAPPRRAAPGRGAVPGAPALGGEGGRGSGCMLRDGSGLLPGGNGGCGVPAGRGQWMGLIAAPAALRTAPRSVCAPSPSSSPRFARKRLSGLGSDRCFYPYLRGKGRKYHLSSGSQPLSVSVFGTSLIKMSSAPQALNK